MPLEIKFLIGGLVLTIVLGFILVPIVRKAMQEDDKRNSDT